MFKRRTIFTPRLTAPGECEQQASPCCRRRPMRSWLFLAIPPGPTASSEAPITLPRADAVCPTRRGADEPIPRLLRGASRIPMLAPRRIRRGTTLEAKAHPKLPETGVMCRLGLVNRASGRQRPTKQCTCTDLSIERGKKEQTQGRHVGKKKNNTALIIPYPIPTCGVPQPVYEPGPCHCAFARWRRGGALRCVVHDVWCCPSFVLSDLCPSRSSCALLLFSKKKKKNSPRLLSETNKRASKFEALTNNAKRSAGRIWALRRLSSLCAFPRRVLARATAIERRRFL